MITKTKEQATVIDSSLVIPILPQSRNGELPKLIGQHIRKLRKSRKLTQKKLGHKVQVHHSYISQIEAGRQISIPLLKKIADVFHVDVEYFFSSDAKKDFIEQILTKEPIRKFIETFTQLHNEDRKMITKLTQYLKDKTQEKK